LMPRLLKTVPGISGNHGLVTVAPSGKFAASNAGSPAAAGDGELETGADDGTWLDGAEAEAGGAAEGGADGATLVAGVLVVPAHADATRPTMMARPTAFERSGSEGVVDMVEPRSALESLAR